MDDPQATNQPGWLARTYTYSATIPHAVTSVSPETGSADTYSQTYNAENRISSIAKKIPVITSANDPHLTN